MKPLTLSDLEGARCSCGSEHHHEPPPRLWLAGPCHPTGPLRVSYRRGTGYLDLTCAACDKPIATVAVAVEIGGVA